MSKSATDNMFTFWTISHGTHSYLIRFLQHVLPINYWMGWYLDFKYNQHVIWEKKPVKRLCVLYFIIGLCLTVENYQKYTVKTKVHSYVIMLRFFDSVNQCWRHSLLFGKPFCLTLKRCTCDCYARPALAHTHSQKTIAWLLNGMTKQTTAASQVDKKVFTLVKADSAAVLCTLSLSSCGAWSSKSIMYTK